ncbi:hypothetical protein [Candidatus Cryosericum odellii]|uniref:Uncharacterized protein n=1 Tax=Candidatus Cryosericum odellii TaxID=2290917 RepID=A0A398D879_9BACT|nr:hypothetical protein [Candidatus Cryosericum odellii]RIE07334.1 hypothetical protein SMC5_09905 [Candidatus Cryosericum odellii]
MGTRMGWLLIKTYDAEGHLSGREGFNLVYKRELDYRSRTEHGQHIMAKTVERQTYSGFLRAESRPQLQANRVLLQASLDDLILADEPFVLDNINEMCEEQWAETAPVWTPEHGQLSSIH